MPLPRCEGEVLVLQRPRLEEKNGGVGGGGVNHQQHNSRGNNTWGGKYTSLAPAEITITRVRMKVHAAELRVAAQVFQRF